MESFKFDLHIMYAVMNGKFVFKIILYQT